MDHVINTTDLDRKQTPATNLGCGGGKGLPWLLGQTDTSPPPKANSPFDIKFWAKPDEFGSTPIRGGGEGWHLSSVSPLWLCRPRDRFMTLNSSMFKYFLFYCLSSVPLLVGNPERAIAPRVMGFM